MSGDANYSPVRAHQREKAAGLAVHVVCSFGEGGTGDGGGLLETRAAPSLS